MATAPATRATTRFRRWARLASCPTTGAYRSRITCAPCREHRFTRGREYQIFRFACVTIATAMGLSIPGPNLRRSMTSGVSTLAQASLSSRASAAGCHPLREVPSLRRRRSIFGLRKTPSPGKPKAAGRDTGDSYRDAATRQSRSHVFAYAARINRRGAPSSSPRLHHPQVRCAR
jgi:hypothetical protein